MDAVQGLMRYMCYRQIYCYHDVTLICCFISLSHN